VSKNFFTAALSTSYVGLGFAAALDVTFWLSTTRHYFSDREGYSQESWSESWGRLRIWGVIGHAFFPPSWNFFPALRNFLLRLFFSNYFFLLIHFAVEYLFRIAYVGA